MAASRSSKSILFEYCQKRKIGPPFFENWAAPNGYQAKVIIDGYPYPTSAIFSKKKYAEHDAAKACLASLGVFEDDNQLGDNQYSNQGYPGDQGFPGNQGYPGGQGYFGYSDSQGYPGANHNGRSSFGTPNPSPSFSTPSPRSADRPPRSGGSSGGGVKMPKSVLHEFCQSQKMSLPQYETEASYDGSALLGFNCVLVVADEYFTTDRLYTNKREAEHAVARKALNVLGYYARSPLYTGDTPIRAAKPPSFQTPDTSYKNLLQEHLQQRSIETPDYETQLTDGGYFSKVIIEGKVFKAKECCKTKKLAEQSAAKAGLVGMGVKDPESVAMRLLKKNSKGRYKSTEEIPYKKDLRDLEPEQLDADQVQGNASWVHSRKQSEFDVDDYDDIDGEFTDFQKAAPVKLKRNRDEDLDEDFFGTPEQRPHKRQRVGEGSDSRPSIEKRPMRRGEFEVQQVHLGNLTVGECWPEKRNIVIVGSDETSIPLFCQADMKRCALEDRSTGELVDIVPGHRLIGLEGYYVVRGGQIVLRARQCQQVVMPDEPDKVLISCGVVVLHCIPRRDGNETSCDVNVLLKRYLCSQAFINVVRGLAQYFRSKQSNRSCILNKDLLTAHIQDWMLEEVMAISSFSETALENVFQHTMKFDKRWAKYLRDEELSQELREIQAAANQELFRRANSGEDQNQDRFRPWRLPKGNFYHRVLTTGVFIENPPEAAMRELKEETGIKLKLSDVISSPYVDIPQADNLNPHKGDFARYYLCGIITDAESYEEEIEEKQAGEETATENTESSSTATDSAPLNTDPTPTDTGSTYAATGSNYAATGSNYAATGSTPAITNSTFNAAYSANAAGYAANMGSSYGSTGSTNTGTNSAYGTGPGYSDTGYANTGAYSAFGSTSTAATTTPYAGTYPDQQTTNSTNAATYSAYNPGTSSTNTGTSSAYGGTGSTHDSTYSAYSAYGNTGPTTTTASAYTSPYSSYTGSNTGNNSANSGAYSANAGVSTAYTATGSNPATGSANTGAYSASTDSYTAYAQTGSNTGTGSANAGAYSANTTAGSTYTATGSNTGSANAGAYSASTGAYSAYGGTGSNTGTGSSSTGAYSVYADAYSAYTSTVASNPATNTSQTGTQSNAASSTETATNSVSSSSTGTNLTNASMGSAHHGAYSAYTHTVQAGTETAPAKQGSTTGSTEKASASTNPLPYSTDKAASGTQGPAVDRTSTLKETPDKSETRNSNVENEREESTVIRSPFVAGAVHEECKWFDMEEAKEISTVFLEIYNSHEFQKLLAKLKGIVSAM